MSRLVCFGCSLTFGLALPDIWPNSEHNSHSNVAWPSVLGSKLNLEVINQGHSGSGQYEIFSRILDFDFQPNDTAVIMWSYFNRLEFFKYLEPRVGTRIFGHHNLFRNIALLTSKCEVDIARKNWLIIQHACLYLRYKNIKTCSILPAEDKHFHPSDLYKIDVFDTIQDISWNYLDYALDNAHPGIESHKDMAEQIYNKAFNVVY